MKKTNIDWPKEIEDFSQSGLSRSEYCKVKWIKNTTFRYHWERRFKNQGKECLPIPIK
ncbi:IS66 family insertion sequence element accessory protein TnpA [Leptospira weilii]